MQNFIEIEESPDYFEPQVQSLCAKHAINNLLQENKVGYKKPPFVHDGKMVSGQFLFKETGQAAPDSADVMDPSIQINMYTICDEFDKTMANVSGFNSVENYIQAEQDALKLRKTGFKNSRVYQQAANSKIIQKKALAQGYPNVKNYLNAGKLKKEAKQFGFETTEEYFQYLITPNSNIEINLNAVANNSNNNSNNENNNNGEDLSRCDSNHQNLPFNGLEMILAKMNYTTYDSYQVNILKDLRERIKQPNLLGIILNLGGGHYVAISKFYQKKSLWKKMADKIELQNVAYIDSFARGPEIVSIAALPTKVRRLNAIAAIFVYAANDSYNSIAVQRLRELEAYDLPIGGSRKNKTRRLRKSKSKKQRKVTRRH